jgi:hypothetical protein
MDEEGAGAGDHASALSVLTEMIHDGYVQIGPAQAELATLLAELDSGRPLDTEQVDRIEAKAATLAERQEVALALLQYLEGETAEDLAPMPSDWSAAALPEPEAPVRPESLLRLEAPVPPEAPVRTESLLRPEASVEVEVAAQSEAPVEFEASVRTEDHVVLEELVPADDTAQPEPSPEVTQSAVAEQKLLVPTRLRAQVSLAFLAVGSLLILVAVLVALL